MTNRVMKQKATKARRQRRAWAKKYSMPSGIVPNRGVLQEYKERACGLGISEFEVDEFILSFYGRKFHGTPAGRVEVEELLKELKNRVPEMLFFSIIDNCLQKAVCYFNSQKTCFVLVHDDRRKKITRRSIEYGSKDRAMQVWNMDRVTWVTREKSQS